MAVLKGLRMALIYLLCGFALFYLAGRFASKALPLSGFFNLFGLVWPIVAGLAAGWHSSSKAWRNGAVLGALIWAVKYLFLCWCLPQLLAWDSLLAWLGYFVVSGMLAGIFGLNLRLARIRENILEE